MQNIQHDIQQLIHLQLQAKSKGGRLTSAMVEIKKKTKAKYKTETEGTKK